MESRDEIRARTAAGARPDLAAVERVYELTARDGMLAGIQCLLTLCHEDVELRSYSAHAAGSSEGDHELLRGHEEILEFFRRREESGFSSRARTRGFEVDGDTIVVRGSARVTRPDGSFAESSVQWRYHFRDGLIDEVYWEPRAGG